MALLAPYEKFIKDITDIVERKYETDGKRSLIIGDIRADVHARMAVIGDNGEVDFYGGTFVNIYYFNSNDEVIPADEKFVRTITKRFKEGKVTVDGDPVEKVTIEHNTPWIYSRGGSTSFGINRVVQTYPDGKMVYYLEDELGVRASSRNPQSYNFHLEPEERPELVNLMEIMKFFNNSQHPDINILQRIKVKEVLQTERGRDVGGLITAYTFD